MKTLSRNALREDMLQRPPSAGRPSHGPRRPQSPAFVPTEPERTTAVRLYLVNPRNPLVCLTHVRESRWNRYRVWKPLGLTTVAALTPPEWKITIFDENLRVPDYSALPRPDLVGITAFTSQANRAYDVATHFRSRQVPVVMGGIHATMCLEEAMARVDAVVTGEAECVWTHVLDDVRNHTLQPRYEGVHAEMAAIPQARNDLLSGDYAFGAIQTTRGCPLNCSFCSVTAFSGRRYRQRPIDRVIREFGAIREKLVLVVDDNLIGTSHSHMARAKDLFRAMIRARLRKQWIAQVTINMADDEELLTLASRAGCVGVFVGLESPTTEGLKEVGKKFNMSNGRDLAASVGRIQRHRILVAGSFILGLDNDEPGIGRRIADVATHYGLDALNTLFLTPLPATRLWDDFESQGRLIANSFPEDWRYYTLTFPVARYRHLSCRESVTEMDSCDRRFYSLWRTAGRVGHSIWHRRRPLVALVANLSYRRNCSLGRASCNAFIASHDPPENDVPRRAAIRPSGPQGCGNQDTNGSGRADDDFAEPLAAGHCEDIQVT